MLLIAWKHHRFVLCIALLLYALNQCCFDPKSCYSFKLFTATESQPQTLDSSNSPGPMGLEKLMACKDRQKDTTATGRTGSLCEATASYHMLALSTKGSRSAACTVRLKLVVQGYDIFTGIFNV